MSNAVSPVDPTPILDPVWMYPLWKPTRPFCLSRIEVTLGAGHPPFYYWDARPLTVQLVIAEDPKDGMEVGYYTIAEAVMEVRGDIGIDRRVVADVPWPFGPRILPPGWWVGACHNSHWIPNDGEEVPVLSIQLHGTDV